jgi:hypothetical protein
VTSLAFALAASATFLGGLLAGCSDDETGTTTPPADSGTSTPEAGPSKCGKPGDVGNSQGVGKYCMSISDCSGNQKATLCSKVGDPETFFCTKLCNPDGGADAGTVEQQCGEATVCECGGGGCGCTPTACTQ